MLKIFRSIRNNLLNEGKTTKYFKYAIGEIILVVIGILIALQVNEWNNERNRNKAEENILTQLQSDLKQSETQLKAIQEFYLVRTKASAKVIRFFWKTEEPIDSVGKHMQIPRSAQIYSPILGTARSLINSGNIDLIRSSDVKIAIIAYVEKVEYLLKDVDRYEQTYYRQGIEEILRVIPNTFESTEDINYRLEESNRSPQMNYLFENDINPAPVNVDKVPFQSDLNHLLKDERIYRAYNNLFTSHRNIWRIYGEILDITVELTEKIEKS